MLGRVAGVGRPLALSAAFVRGHDVLGWIALDSAKPGRPHHNRYVLHPTSDWSARHLEDPKGTVIEAIISALNGLLDKPVTVVSTGAHRWRYARPWEDQPPFDAGCLDINPWLFCGDYVNGGRVEGAWLSGKSAAQALVDKINP